MHFKNQSLKSEWTQSEININDQASEDECHTLIFEILSTFHTLKALWMKWVTLDTHEYTTAITISV